MAALDMPICHAPKMLFKGCRWVEDPAWLDLPHGLVTPNFYTESFRKPLLVGARLKPDSFSAKPLPTTPTSASVLVLGSYISLQASSSAHPEDGPKVILGAPSPAGNQSLQV